MVEDDQRAESGKRAGVTDGSAVNGPNGRISILRQDTYRIEPYTSALPVAPPPS